MHLYTGQNMITDTNWHHIALTSNGATIKLYVDGVEKALTPGLGANTGQWFNTTSDAAQFTIGALLRGSAIVPVQGAIDDVRVAETIARTESTLRRRGTLRIRRQIEQAGVAGATARRAIDEVMGAIDTEALLEASLARRLHGRERIANDAEFRRLYRYLMAQGFESERIIKALTARRRD